MYTICVVINKLFIEYFLKTKNNLALDLPNCLFYLTVKILNRILWFKDFIIETLI